MESFQKRLLFCALLALASPLSFADTIYDWDSSSWEYDQEESFSLEEFKWSGFEEFQRIPPTHLLVNSSAECGKDVLNATSGTISYKPFESIGPNERCVWIIRAENATEYLVAISNLGFEPGTDHKLTLTRFPADHTLPVEYTVADHDGLYDLDGTSVLLVTFHSGNSSGNTTGFSLEYTAQSLGTRYVSSASKDSFYNSTQNGFAHASLSGPSEGYTRLDLFLFHSENHIYSEDNLMNLAYIKKSWSTYISVMEVYSFSPEKDWELVDVIGERNETAMIESRDMLLLAYRSPVHVIYTSDFHLTRVNVNTGSCNK